MKPLPLPVRVAAGLAVVAIDRAKHLPEKLAELPVTVVSQALQLSMRVQQQVTELAIKGDDALASLRPVEETPGWATFDEDEADEGDFGPDLPAPRSSTRSRFDRVQVVDLAERRADSRLNGGQPPPDSESIDDQPSERDWSGTDIDAAGAPTNGRVDEATELTDTGSTDSHATVTDIGTGSTRGGTKGGVDDSGAAGSSAGPDADTSGHDDAAGPANARQDETTQTGPSPADADQDAVGAGPSTSSADENITSGGRGAADTASPGAGQEPASSGAGPGTAGNTPVENTTSGATDHDAASDGVNQDAASDTTGHTTAGSGGASHNVATGITGPDTASGGPGKSTASNLTDQGTAGSGAHLGTAGGGTDRRAVSGGAGHDTAGGGAGQGMAGPAVLPGYPELSLPQVRARLRKLTISQLQELVEYERKHDNRPEFVGMLTRRITTLRTQR